LNSGYPHAHKCDCGQATIASAGDHQIEQRFGSPDAPRNSPHFNAKSTITNVIGFYSWLLGGGCDFSSNYGVSPVPLPLKSSNGSTVATGVLGGSVGFY